MKREIFGIPESSPQGATSECEPMIVSVSVVPERGIPTMKIGVGAPAGSGLACWGPCALW